MPPYPRVLSVAALALAAACAGVPAARADDLAWASDASNNLWRINFTAGSANLIGNTGIFIEELAYSPTGVLNATTYNGQLYRLDTQTGLATWVGSTGLGDIEGLDWVGQDLVASNFAADPTLYRINPLTGQATWLRDLNYDTGSLRSLEALDLHTLIGRGDAGGGTLFRINVDTGAVTTLGPMAAMIAGLEVIGPRVYGVGDDGQLYRVNAASGAVTQIGDVGNQYFTGLASVPAPGGAALLGCVGAAAMRRRR
jgi:outer membrane protein assembly factor BamB